ncbi:MAG: cysteine--tRNA ligase [Mailhella sp.]|nr:cysteine--tRNA ligase [Mailhella sp.]
MQLYNTMTRRKEQFEPRIPGKVGMYACGITAYDFSHIGHARSAVVFDVLVRWLRHCGYDLTFVRNFTDVDDKIIARANREGRTSAEIAETYIEAFHEDMDRLNVVRPDIEPRATEYIAEMQDMIRRLIEKGHAYPVPSGDVYFRVRSFAEYGKLSGRDVNDLRSGARIAVGEEKEDPLDFALWKAAKPGEPFWESPWGLGRPGWHLECSAMSEKNLDLPLDIHGGGQDLVFPHHENEIAQSEAAIGRELARFWVHNGFVQINSEKMSKSLGNFKTIRDILENRQPETLRFFLLGKHYRSPIDFSFDGLDDAEKALRRVYECLRDARVASERASWKKGEMPAEVLEEFEALEKGFTDSMNDDLNTAGALGSVFGMVRLINRVLDDKALRARESFRDLLARFSAVASVWSETLGVFGEDPAAYLASQRDMRALRAGIDTARVEELLAERAEARKNKDFARSDAARDALAAMGVEVRDTPSGAVWDIA